MWRDNNVSLSLCDSVEAYYDLWVSKCVELTVHCPQLRIACWAIHNIGHQSIRSQELSTIKFINQFNCFKWFLSSSIVCCWNDLFISTILYLFFLFLIFKCGWLGQAALLVFRSSKTTRQVTAQVSSAAMRTCSRFGVRKKWEMDTT